MRVTRKIIQKKRKRKKRKGKRWSGGAGRETGRGRMIWGVRGNRGQDVEERERNWTVSFPESCPAFQRITAWCIWPFSRGRGVFYTSAATAEIAPWAP